MASEGSDNKTLVYVACIGAALVVCVIAFVLGIGSNPGNPEGDQLNNNATDVTNPKMQALIAKLQVNIDGCESLLQNQPAVETLQLQISSLPDDMGALKKTDGSPSLTDTQLENIRATSTDIKANLDKLLQIAAECRQQRAPSENVSALWETARTNATSLIDGSLTGERLSVYFNRSEDLTDAEIDETGADPGGSGSTVPLIRQDNYKSTPYPRSRGSSSESVAAGGCGLVSAVMVLQFYGVNLDVPTAAQYALDNGFRGRGKHGTDYTYFTHIAKKYNLKYLEPGLTKSGWDKIVELLKNGTPVIVSGKGAKPYSQGGHFVVLTDIKADGTIGVNNPAKRLQDKTSYTLEHLKKYTHSARVIYR